MKLKSILLILFINLLGCESVDHQKMNETPAANNEPSWAPFVKENNMDWSKHYWTDREKNGNQGYLERHPYRHSEYKSPESSKQLEAPSLSQERQSPQSLEKQSAAAGKVPIEQPPAMEEKTIIQAPAKVEVGHELPKKAEQVEIAPKEKQNSESPVKVKETRKAAVKEKPVQTQKINIKEKQTPVVRKVVQAPKKAEIAKIKIQEYIVKKGESLWKIAGLREVYGDSSKWQKIYDANRNKMKSPGQLYPGQVLIIPRE